MMRSFRSRDQLANQLRSRIRSGEIASGAKLESVREIARRGKYGPPTVIRAIEVLVGEGYLVTRKRQGVYVADKSAWKPATRHIAILTGVPSPDSSRFLRTSSYLSGVLLVQDRMLEIGRRVTIQGCLHHPHNKDQRSYIVPRDLGLKGVDVLVVAGMCETQYLTSLLDLNIPIISYDLDATDARMDSAFLDDVGSAFELTSRLIEQGHRKIIHVGMARNAPRRELLFRYSPSTEKRADGYRLAMRQHGLEARVFHAERGDGLSVALSKGIAESADCTAVVLQSPCPLQDLAGRKLAFGSWWSKPPCEWPAHYEVIAECDFEQMGEAVCDILEARLATPDAPVQRRMIQPDIRVRPD
jgi:DNA-binding LacI/PurR family transcriptional regulator